MFILKAHLRLMLDKVQLVCSVLHFSCHFQLIFIYRVLRQLKEVETIAIFAAIFGLSITLIYSALELENVEGTARKTAVQIFDFLQMLLTF